MKYKIIGWLNLVSGSVGLAQQVLMLLLVYPKLKSLYNDLQAQLPLSTQVFPYISLLVCLILVLVIFLGAQLAFTNRPTEKLFKLGVAALIAILLFGGLYLSALLLSVITPVYSLSSSL